MDDEPDDSIVINVSNLLEMSLDIPFSVCWELEVLLALGISS